VFPEHIALLDELLISPPTSDDVRVLDDVLGRVRHDMRAAPPRSASPRRRKKH